MGSHVFVIGIDGLPVLSQPLLALFRPQCVGHSQLQLNFLLGLHFIVPADTTTKLSIKQAVHFLMANEIAADWSILARKAVPWLELDEPDPSKQEICCSRKAWASELWLSILIRHEMK